MYDSHCCFLIPHFLLGSFSPNSRTFPATSLARGVNSSRSKCQIGLEKNGGRWRLEGKHVQPASPLPGRSSSNSRERGLQLIRQKKLEQLPAITAQFARPAFFADSQCGVSGLHLCSERGRARQG